MLTHRPVPSRPAAWISLQRPIWHDDFVCVAFGVVVGQTAPVALWMVLGRQRLFSRIAGGALATALLWLVMFCLGLAEFGYSSSIELAVVTLLPFRFFSATEGGEHDRPERP